MTSTAHTTFKLMTCFTNLWTLLIPIMLEKQEAFVLKYFDAKTLHTLCFTFAEFVFLCHAVNFRVVKGTKGSEGTKVQRVQNIKKRQTVTSPFHH